MAQENRTGRVTRPHRRRFKQTPFRFDETTASKIITFLRAGAFIETAAQAAGISKQTLYNWLRKAAAEDAHPRLAKWGKDVEEAQALAEIAMMGVIGNAAQTGVWQAAAWHLERKFPERWGRREEVKVSGKEDGDPIKVQHENVRKMTTEAVRKRLGDLLAAVRLRRGESPDVDPDPVPMKDSLDLPPEPGEATRE